MEASSRTAKSLKNSTITMAYLAVQFVLGFYSRKIFIDYLGTEILGLNTTAVNILQFLNLAELGIGAAVGFSLFKPLHNANHDEICDIVSLQGYLYRRIAWGIIAASVCVMAAFPWIFNKMDLPLWYAYASFAAVLFSALLDYFVNYRQVVLSSAQMDYKIRYSQTSWVLVKIVLQMAAVKYLHYAYEAWLILEFVFTIIAALALRRATRKTFPYLTESAKPFKTLKQEYAVILSKIKQVFVHKFGVFAFTQTSPLIIYAYISLDMVALYGNYQVITLGVNRLFSALFSSINAGVGDLVAEGDKTKILSVFKELFSLRFGFTSTIVFTIFMVSQPFIVVWLGEQYLLPLSTLAIICCTLFVGFVRGTVDSYLNAYGLFRDIWAPIAEAAINIGLSLLLGYFYGLNGILSGVLISLCLIIGLWKPYFLFRYGLKVPISKYIRLTAYNSAVAIVVGLAMAVLCLKLPFDPAQSYLHFGLYAFICLVGYALGFTVLACIFKLGLEIFLRRMLVQIGLKK